MPKPSVKITRTIQSPERHRTVLASPGRFHTSSSSEPATGVEEHADQ